MLGNFILLLLQSNLEGNFTLEPQLCKLHMQNKAKSSLRWSTHIVKAIQSLLLEFGHLYIEISHLEIKDTNFC